jgi:predicted CoA-substrate-specific enzyme activase
MTSHVFAGVDIGSTTAKALVLDENNQMWTAMIPSGTRPPQAGMEVFQMALEQSHHSPSDVGFIIATGYGRVSASFANKTVTEIACHGRGAHFLDPSVRTIIDIGGQDAKSISLSEAGKVVDFSINDKCASGTGRFLESAAQLVLHVPLEDLGRLSSQAKTKVTISSTCTVFAQTELISLLAAGESIESVVAGLHASIANKVGGMAKRLGVRPTVMMTGGVAKNMGVVQALKQELGMDIVIPAKVDPQLVGALGAAFIARETIQSGGGNHG